MTENRSLWQVLVDTFNKYNNTYPPPTDRFDLQQIKHIAKNFPPSINRFDFTKLFAEYASH